MANPSPGQNDKCWCGSTKKFKHCHRDRDRMQPLRADEIGMKLDDVYSEPRCLHPDSPCECSTIVTARTIQNHGQLDRISNGGHVIGVDRSYLNIDKHRPPFISIGVNKASTYKCFCGKHDDETFKPIETTAIHFTPHQCFLFGYRAVCRAVYLTRQRLKSFALLRELDRGTPYVQQKLIQANLADLEELAEAKLRALEDTKNLNDQVLRSRDFEQIAFLAVRLRETPSILGSNVLFPQCDFAGAPLQSLAIGSRIDVLTFSLIATSDNAGAALFVWHKEHDNACRAFVDSLRRLSASEAPHAITRLVFSFCENSYFSPAWWNGLTAEIKEALKNDSSRA